jgi:hypothetical protein
MCCRKCGKKLVSSKQVKQPSSVFTTSLVFIRKLFEQEQENLETTALAKSTNESKQYIEIPLRITYPVLLKSFAQKSDDHCAEGIKNVITVTCDQETN